MNVEKNIMELYVLRIKKSNIKAICKSFNFHLWKSTVTFTFSKGSLTDDLVANPNVN